MGKTDSSITRRQFLGATAGSTILSAVPTSAWTRVQGANDRVRIGLIGCGTRGGRAGATARARCGAVPSCAGPAPSAAGMLDTPTGPALMSSGSVSKRRLLRRLHAASQVRGQAGDHQ